jgi:hypothetical protein
MAAPIQRSCVDVAPSARLVIDVGQARLRRIVVRKAQELKAMETSVRAFFERYESIFNRALNGDTDLDEVAALYASEFIAASPAGVSAGKNDDALKRIMVEGYARYRSMGTKLMRVREVRISAIDALHCLADVAWTATYARAGQAEVAIDFDVHYLVQMLNRTPKVFGWVSGDEQALLEAHGIV